LFAEKRCFKRGETKGFDSFYKHSRMSDGRLNKCIDCTKEDVKKHRQENLEKVREYDRLRGSMPHRVAARKEYSKTAAYAESHRASTKRWMEKHPERKKASTSVNNAIRRGKLKKFPCLVCGNETSEAHHPDYSRPLDVVWLCTSHHQQVHTDVANYAKKGI